MSWAFRIARSDGRGGAGLGFYPDAKVGYCNSMPQAVFTFGEIKKRRIAKLMAEIKAERDASAINVMRPKAARQAAKQSRAEPEAQPAP